MRFTAMTVAFLLAAFVSESALAQVRPTIPNSALPGREREQLWGRPGPPLGVPQIELRDGRPAPVIQPSKKRKPVKRRNNRTRRN
jgi:hypothetical protein